LKANSPVLFLLVFSVCHLLFLGREFVLGKLPCEAAIFGSKDQELKGQIDRFGFAICKSGFNLSFLGLQP
jgi:hypothetical protein